MLQFYIPEIKGVEEVRQEFKKNFILFLNYFSFKAKTETDEIAEKEFTELDKKIENDKPN